MAGHVRAVLAAEPALSADGRIPPGPRAPAHALFIGLFGSLLVAMVSRFTQGHSGRPLKMYGLAWFAFLGIQVVAAIRIAAGVMPDVLLWQALSAAGWLLALAPWVFRIGRIYLSPRADGQPG